MVLKMAQIIDSSRAETIFLIRPTCGCLDIMGHKMISRLGNEKKHNSDAYSKIQKHYLLTPMKSIQMK